MSIIFMDSLSRYGNVDKANVSTVIGRKGWSLGGNAWRHRTQASMFGQPYVSLHSGIYSDNDYDYYLASNLSRPLTGITLPGISFKFAYYMTTSGIPASWMQIVRIIRGASQDIGLAMRVNNPSVNTSTIDGVGATINAVTGGAGSQQAYFSAQPSSTVVTGSVNNSPNANITTLAWYTVDLRMTTATAMQWRIVTPTGEFHTNTLTIANSAPVSLQFGGISNGFMFTQHNNNDGLCYADVVLYQVDGSGVTSFLDNPRSRTIKRLTVDNVGHYNNWTPTSGTNDSVVSETPYADGDYSSGLSVGSKQTFSFTGLGTGSLAIKKIDAIQVNSDLVDNGDAVSAAAPIQTVAGTDSSLGSDLTISRTNVTNYNVLRTTNPITGQPYSVAEIEALDIGFTVV